MLAFLFPYGRSLRGLPPPLVSTSRRYSGLPIASWKAGKPTTTPANLTAGVPDTAGADQFEEEVFSISTSDSLDIHAGASTSSRPGTSARRTKQHVSNQRDSRTPLYLAPEVQEPTVGDLHRFHPRYIPDPATQSHRYKQMYKATRDSLGRSFNRDQLHSFVGTLLGITPSRRSRKSELLDLILSKAWGLSSPAQLEDERRERTEINRKVFSVSPAELFILLGEDGNLFKSLASAHNATLFVESHPDMVIRAEATSADLEQLSAHMQALINELVTASIELPGSVAFGDAVVQAMSRRVGVYIEQTDPRTLRVTAKTHDDIARSERLATRAWMMHTSQNVVIAHSTTSEFSARYSMYPHSSVAPLPWYTGAKSAFRARRVSKWLVGSKMGPISSLDCGGTYFGTDLAATPSLREILPRMCGTDEQAPFKVRATTGHVLFTDTNGSKSLHLHPTIAGSEDVGFIEMALERVKQGLQRTTFLPSLPCPLLRVEHLQPTEVIRVTYRHIASPIDTELNRILPERGPSSVLAPSTLTYELSLQGKKSPPIPCLDSAASGIPPLSEGGSGQVITGPLFRADCFLPDRPMDLQLNVTLPNQTIEIMTPPEMVEYRERVLKCRQSDDGVSGPPTTPFPIPPSRMILPNNELFLLESAHHIVRSVHRLPSPIASFADADTWPELHDMLSRLDSDRPTTSIWAQEIAHAKARMGAEVILESTRDLESSDSFATCSVECQNPSDDTALGDFLRKCDLMTTHMYPGVPVGSRSPALTSPTV